MFASRYWFALACSAWGMMLLRSIASAAVSTPMPPMEHIGPQSRSVDLKEYAHVIHVVSDRPPRAISGVLASIADASARNRYAVLVAAGTYAESRLQMKPHVDLYGGFAAGDWKERDIYKHATILDGQQKGPVVLAADDVRLDGF